MTPDNEIKTIDWGRATIGGLILLVGAAMLVDVQMDLMGYRLVEFWPLLVVGIGLSRLSNAQSVRSQRGGFLLVFIGIWLLIASLGLWGFDFGNSWPLAIIAVGIATLLRPDCDSRHGGYWLLAVGLIFLMMQVNPFGLSWRTMWPLFIILAGGSIIWKSLRGDRWSSRGHGRSESAGGGSNDNR